MLFNKYPYTDFHELNLDWIIRTIKALDAEIDNFIAFNKVTFRGTWNGDPYPAWTVVDDGSGNGFLSIQAVPANVPLTDTAYWTQVAAYSTIYSAFNSRITALESFEASVPGTYVPQTRTVNGNALSNNITVDSLDVPYNNTISGLSATNVKTAIDEVDGFVDSLRYEAYATFTETGITYKVYRLGHIVQLKGESGTLDSNISAGSSIATIPSGYRPRYQTVWIQELESGKRLVANLDGTIIASGNSFATGDAIRFTVTYICQ